MKVQHGDYLIGICHGDRYLLIKVIVPGIVSGSRGFSRGEESTGGQEGGTHLRGSLGV